VGSTKRTRSKLVRRLDRVLPPLVAAAELHQRRGFSKHDNIAEAAQAEQLRILADFARVPPRIQVLDIGALGGANSSTSRPTRK